MSLLINEARMVYMDALRQFRHSTGLSQEKMAQRMGISYSMYHKVECGQAKASRGFMDRFKEQFPFASMDAIFFPSVEQDDKGKGDRK